MRRVLRTMATPIFEQSYADRGGCGMGQFGAGQRGFAQLLHQRIRQRREQDAQPVGKEFLTAGACTEQIQLGFLDPVLRLPALAIQAVIQFCGRQVEVGDDEAWIRPPCAPNSRRVMMRRSMLQEPA